MNFVVIIWQQKKMVLINFNKDLMTIQDTCYNGAFLFNEDFDDDEDNNKHIIYIEKLLLKVIPIDDI